MARWGNIRLPVRGGRAVDFSDRSAGSPYINPRGDVCIAQGLPPEAELARLGHSYVGRASMAHATAVPPLTDFSSSNFQGTVLWNGENFGGKSYVISTAIVDVGGATSFPSIVALYGHNYAARHTSGNQNLAALGITQLNGLGATPSALGFVPSSFAQFGIYSSATYPLEGNMHPIGVAGDPKKPPPPVTIGPTFCQEYYLYGRYIVPPRGVMAFVEADNGSMGIVSHLQLIWHEVQLPVVN